MSENDSGNMAPEARIKVLADNAAELTMDPEITCSQYMRSGKEMLRSAANYDEDGEAEHAYTLYMRYLTLTLNKMRDHPGFDDIPAAEKKVLISYCNKVLPKSEALKTVLLKKYEKQYEEYMVHLDVFFNKAKKLAKEMNEKAEPEEKSTSKEATWKWESKWPFDKNESPSASTPLVPDPKSLAMGSSRVPFSQLPYKNILDLIEVKGENHEQPGKSGGGLQSKFERSIKPSRLLSPMSSGLRQVIIPGDIVTVFLNLAKDNTDQNVETCGFLTGNIRKGKLLITDLIVPKQEGTSDSCTASHEEEYSVVQDKLDLITFGWIHTHPTQTAFLSSVDMHTHFWYQSMMPEAIAIVCAPSKERVGVFNLTPEAGMKVIGSCTKTDFHPHQETGCQLFTGAYHHLFDQTMHVRVHDLRKL